LGGRFKDGLRQVAAVEHEGDLALRLSLHLAVSRERGALKRGLNTLWRCEQAVITIA